MIIGKNRGYVAIELLIVSAFILGLTGILVQTFTITTKKIADDSFGKIEEVIKEVDTDTSTPGNPDPKPEDNRVMMGRLHLNHYYNENMTGLRGEYWEKEDGKVIVNFSDKNYYEVGFNHTKDVPYFYIDEPVVEITKGGKDETIKIVKKWEDDKFGTRYLIFYDHNYRPDNYGKAEREFKISTTIRRKSNDKIYATRTTTFYILK